MAFWREKSLTEMSREEWESLCDGCARCCLEKLEDTVSGEISHTNVACVLLDTETCSCSNYAERFRFMPDCVPLNPKNVHELRWMPSTCAYRMLAEGKDLAPWHPLVSGARHTVVTAGISVKGRCIAGRDAVGELEDYIVEWPE